VRVISDSAIEQDEAPVAEEATQLVDTETHEAEETGDGEDAVDTEDIAESDDKSCDDAETDDPKSVEPQARRRRITWSRVLAFGVLPVLALLIATAAGFLKWQDACNRSSGVAAGIEPVAAAKDSTVAILSYQPDSVEKDLGAARDRLTGKFKDSYTQLVHDVVIPGAKKDHISAVATVPAAASVSATPDHAVALVFVNQTVTVGNDAPTGTASTVRVTMDKIGNRWLISAFDPV
jgi:Mce-associated membrane protein